jgi:hypothetical protein
LIRRYQIFPPFPRSIKFILGSGFCRFRKLAPITRQKRRIEKMFRQLLAVLLLTTVYAVMRYAGFGDVSLSHLPGYLLNKGIAMAAVVALFMAAQGLVRSQPDTVRFWGRGAAHLVFLHVLLALALLSKGNYPKFFDADRMSLTGEGMLLFGVLSAYCFWRLGASDIKPAIQRTLTTLGCALVAVHLLIMGYGGWLQPQKWHGGLPPITLLCFILAMYSLIAFQRTKEKHIPLSSAEGRVPPQAEMDY